MTFETYTYAGRQDFKRRMAHGTLVFSEKRDNPAARATELWWSRQL